jgi:hypothetical protein
LATALLNLHSGGRIISLEELRQCKTPPAEGRWHPVPHAEVYQRVRETLDAAGYVVASEQLAIHRGDNRFFGVMELTTPVSNGVCLAVGLRNSCDRSYPMGFAAGNRVHCCSNLAFSAELIRKRKHSRFGQQRFSQDIAEAVAQLSSFKVEEERRIKVLQETAVDDTLAESRILRAWHVGIVSNRYLGDVLAEWRKPSFEEFGPRTAWSLMNSFTTVLGRAQRHVTQPAQYCAQTMQLMKLLSPAAEQHIDQAS